MTETKVIVCNGWTRWEHKSDEKLILVLFNGCKHCGGADCGDMPDVISLCRICLDDLKNDTEIDRWKILENENDEG